MGVAMFKAKKVKFLDKRTTHIDKKVQFGNNVTIYENVRIEGDCVIGDNVVIKPNCYIINCKIGDGVVVDNSVLEDSVIMNECVIGPFSHLRPNSILCDKAKIGNFVEIKNATIGKGSKVNHLAYVGDAELGENCNIGCGAIFVNYNGRQKSRTIVGDNCFIGSNCNVIAPVNIKSDSYICAGTTVTEDVESDDFVIGRARASVKKNRAHEYLKIREK